MKPKCFKCGEIANLPEGHRLIVCSTCGAVQGHERVGFDNQTLAAVMPLTPTQELSAKSVDAATVNLGAVAEAFKMGLTHYVPLVPLPFQVNEHLIECGEISWQMQNIAATAVGERIVPLKVPEPRMAFVRPESAYIVAIGIAGFAGLSCFALQDSRVFGWLVFFATLCLLIMRNRKQIAMWDAASIGVARRHKKWLLLGDNPLKLYSLMLETNAGSKPLFYSSERSEIEQANNAIKDAMLKKIGAGRNFVVKVLDPIFLDPKLSIDESIDKLASAIGTRFVDGDA